MVKKNQHNVRKETQLTEAAKNDFKKGWNVITLDVPNETLLWL